MRLTVLQFIVRIMVSYDRFSQASYLINLEPHIAKMIFRARLRMYVNFNKKYS